MDKWITSLLTCVFRQNSPAACRVRPAKSVFGRHSPAGWQFPRRTACFASAAFCRLPFSAAGRFPARPIDRQNAGFAYFLVRRCKPVPRGGRMSANSQDGGQTSRKTADKRFAAKQAARPSDCRLGKARRFGKRGRICLEKRRIFRQMHRSASFALPKPSPLCRAAAAFIPAASLPYPFSDTEAQKAPRVKGRRFPRLSGRNGRNIYFLLQKQKRT